MSDAGLRTTGLPHARAGASFQDAISIGKFHGTIRPHTPTGTRSTTPMPSSWVGHDRAEVLVGRAGVVLEHVGRGLRLPAGVGDGVAGVRHLEPRELLGIAPGSARPPGSRTLPRSVAEVVAHVPAANASAAPATARSTSAGPGLGDAGELARRSRGSRPSNARTIVVRRRARRR